MELYRRYGPALLRKAERMLQDRDEAKDVVQGLFLDLLQRPDTPAELPYLYRAITHRCLNHLRDRRNQGRLLSNADASVRGLARTLLDDRVVDRQLLASLADRIDAQAWEIVVYHFVDDLTQDEIATLIGTSRKTVVRRLQSIREEARRLAEAAPATAPTRGGSHDGSALHPRVVAAARAPRAGRAGRGRAPRHLRSPRHLRALPRRRRPHRGRRRARSATAAGGRRQPGAAAPLPALPPPGSGRWFPWGRRQAFVVATAAAAAFALVIGLRPRDQPRIGQPPTAARVVATKGGDVAIELVRERDGSVAWEPTSFTPGDRFKLLVTCPPPLQLHADIVVLQSDGPAFPGDPALIACGNRVPVLPAFRITGPGPATVCVAFDPSGPPSRAALSDGDMAAMPGRICVHLDRAD